MPNDTLELDLMQNAFKVAAICEVGGCWRRPRQ